MVFSFSKKILLFFTTLTLMISCGGTNKKASNRRITVNPNIVVDPAAGFKLTCSDESQNTVSSFKKVKAKEIYVNSQDERKNLCEVMTDSAKKAAIFQLVSADCEECLRAMANLALRLRISGYYSSIAHIVVIVPSSDEAGDKILQDEIDKSISDKMIVVDSEKMLFSKFSAFEDSLVPTFLALNFNMEANLINEPDAKYLEIVPATEELVKAYDPEAKPETPPDRQPVDTTWDLKSYLGNSDFKVIAIQ